MEGLIKTFFTTVVVIASILVLFGIVLTIWFRVSPDGIAYTVPITGKVLTFTNYVTTGCPVQWDTYEYQGCETQYRTILRNDTCIPCGGEVPCEQDYSRNNKIEILNCLCDDKKTTDANAFAIDQLFEDYISQNGDICQHRPRKAE